MAGLSSGGSPSMGTLLISRRTDAGSSLPCVAAVGTYKGSRWFVFYLCGKAVTVTDRGQYFVLYEQYEYDDGFIETTKEAVIDAGLTKGNYTEYTQRSNCLYNWHHIAVENGNEWEDDHH